MAHDAQRAFFQRTRDQFPRSFTHCRVLDCGSLNVNGSLRELCTECHFVGIDLRAGPAVDHVGRVHEYRDRNNDPYDTVLSAEMLEHDEWWEQSLQAMYRLLKPGGLLALSCAGYGRPEHGTANAPDSIRGPQGDGLWGTSPEYYRPLSMWDLTVAFGSFADRFSSYSVEYRGAPICDLYFWGLKRP